MNSGPNDHLLISCTFSYLHINGFIHRDVKAANLLIDDDGTVLLGDLGVAANLAEDSSQNHHSSSAPAPSSNKNGRFRRSNGSHDSGRRVILVEPPITPLQSSSSPSQSSRPKIFKRKSFVGTVSRSSFHSMHQHIQAHETFISRVGWHRS